MNVAGLLLSGAALIVSLIALFAPGRPVSQTAPGKPNPGWPEVQAGFRKLEDRLKALESREPEGGTRVKTTRDDPGTAGSENSAPRTDGADALADDLLDRGLTPEELEKTLDRVRKGGLQKAFLKAAERRAASHPPDARAHYLLARAIIEQLMIEPSYAAKVELGNRSLQEYDRAIALDPRFWEPRFEKAESLTYYPESMGRTPEAIRGFEALVELQASAAQDPKFARTYAHLARLYLRIGKSERALHAIQEGVRLFPQDEELRSQLELLQRK